MRRLTGRFWLALLLLSAAASAEIPIEGRVTAEDPGVWRDAEVRLYAVTSVYEEGRRQLLGEDEGEPVDRARLDGDGRFEIPAPRPGLWRVVVSVPGQGAMEHRLLPLRSPVSLPPLPLGGPETSKERDWRRLGEPARPAPEGSGRAARVLDSQGRGVAAALAIDFFGPFGMSSEDGYLELSDCEKGCTIDVVTKEGHWKVFRIRAPAGEDPIELQLDLPGRVQGRVVSRPGGEPLPNAVVWSFAQESFWLCSDDPTYPSSFFRFGAPLTVTTSDARGRFELVLPPASRLTVGAAAPEYGGAELSEVEAVDDGAVEVELVLPAWARFEGQVVDVDGEPLAGVEISGKTPSVRDPLRGRSSEDGGFRLHNVAAEKSYKLHFKKPGFADREYVLDPVAPFDTRTARVVLDWSRRGVGRVLAEDGTPVAGAVVRLLPETFSLESGNAKYYREKAPAYATDAEGRFTFPDLHPGTHVLEAQAAGFASRIFRGIPVEGGRPDDVELGTLVLEPEAPVFGQVLDATGSPIAEAEVRVLLKQGWLPNYGEDPDLLSDAEGRFSVPGLGAGESRALVFFKPGFGSQSAQVAAPTEEALEVVLPRSARLAGHVVATAGVQAAKIDVGAGPRDDRDSNSRYLKRPYVTAEEDGSFVLEDVAPGPWVVVAHERSGPETLASARVELEVQAGMDRDDVVLVLEPTNTPTLTVDLEDADGGLVADASVFMIYRTRRGHDTRGCSSQRNGRYQCSLSRMTDPVNTVTVFAWGRREGETSRQVDLAVESSTVLTFGPAESSLVGQVMSAGGDPTSGADVELSRHSVVQETGHREIRQIATAMTRSDGTFRFDGLAAGDYVVQVSKVGLAGAREELEVYEAAVTELTIRLSAGRTLRGRILGVPSEDLHLLSVVASGDGPMRSGRVDSEGRYVIEDLNAGKWTVRAELGQNGRRVLHDVTLEAGGETDLDLEFPALWTVSGTVLANSSPLPDASISLRGADPRSPGGRTDAQGRFRIEEVPAGRYRVSVAAGGSLLRALSLELDSDRELTLDIRTSAVEGHVRAADSGEPFAGVILSLESAELGGESLLPMAARRGRTISDADGFFRFGYVPEGTWRVRTVDSHDGFAPAEAIVTTRAGDDVKGLDLTLEPTEGITFQVVLESGEIPPSIAILVIDGSGRRVVEGVRSPSADGTVRVSTVPDGNWDLWVLGRGQNSAFTRTAFKAPGHLGRVVLPSTGLLFLKVAGLKGRLAPGWLTLIGPDGKSFRPPPFFGDFEAWPVMGEGAGVPGLVPGLWHYTLQHPDGRTWTGEFTALAGERVEISIP